MKRQIYSLVMLFVIGVSFYAIFQRNSLKRNCEYLIDQLALSQQMGTAVYATRDIKIGELVTGNAVETKLLAINKMPDHMICKESEVIGLRPIHVAEKGQLLTKFHFKTSREVLKDCFEREDGSKCGLFP